MTSPCDWLDDLDGADVEPEGNEPEGEPGDEPFPEVESRGGVVTVRALMVACPVCHAAPGRPCIRPLAQQDRRHRAHRERWAVFYARAAA